MAGLLPSLLDAAWFSRAGGWGRGASRELAQAVFPSACAACQRPGSTLCRACWAAVRTACSSPDVVDDLAALDVLAPRTTAPVVACGPYTGAVAAALLESKRASGRALACRFASVLSPGLVALDGRPEVRATQERAREHPPGPGAPSASSGSLASLHPLLVPVPSTAASLRRRGFSPLDEMLRGSALPSGWRVARALRCVHPLARRWRGGTGGGGGGGKASQKARGRRARASAVRGSLEVPPGWELRGAVVLVVDDVMTTGSTLAEAARVLRSEGATVLGAVVVAHVPAPQRDCADG